MKKSPEFLGALEAGGTKMVMAICDTDGNIISRKIIPTKSPDETLPEMISYYKSYDISALGIATFGPVDLNKNSSTYGNILMTPKTKWVNYPLLSTFQNSLHIPMLIDTDVNGSCLGEVTYGDSKGLTDVIYITIGTGIGAGIISGGNMIHGMMHPEAGHIPVTPRSADPGKCICPYHTNCLEGLASGPSIEKRWGLTADKLLDRDEVWELEADYISDALVSFIMTLSPQRIILGGGVMHVDALFPLIRTKVKEKLNGYIRSHELEDMDSYITPPSLKDDQGILGALRLAITALENATDKPQAPSGY